MWVGGMCTQSDMWWATSPSEKRVAEAHGSIYLFLKTRSEDIKWLASLFFLVHLLHTPPCYPLPLWDCIFYSGVRLVNISLALDLSLMECFPCFVLLNVYASLRPIAIISPL